MSPQKIQIKGCLLSILSATVLFGILIAETLLLTIQHYIRH